MDNLAFQGQMAQNPYVTASVAATRLNSIQLKGRSKPDDDTVDRLAELAYQESLDEIQNSIVADAPTGANVDFRA
jgi:hypothetical protein